MPRIPLTRPTVPSLPSRKRRRPPSQPHASSLPVATAQRESAQPSGTLHTALDPSQSTDSISCPPAPPSRIPDTGPWFPPPGLSAGACVQPLHHLIHAFQPHGTLPPTPLSHHHPTTFSILIPSTTHCLHPMHHHRPTIHSHHSPTTATHQHTPLPHRSATTITSPATSLHHHPTATTTQTPLRLPPHRHPCHQPVHYLSHKRIPVRHSPGPLQPAAAATRPSGALPR
jgi:hypothetical protein